MSRQQQIKRRPSKREETAMWTLENAVLSARRRGEPTGRSHAVSAATAALVEVLDEELDGASAA